MKTHRPLAITLALLTFAAPLQATPQAWQWTIPPRYEAARPFDATGLAAVQLGGKWGLIDKSGKQILPCAYDEITAYPEEQCFALRTGTQWGLADSSGKIILRPEWQAVQPLVRGFIPVQRHGKWGYADASGKLVIPCAWDDAWRFSPAGTAVVTKGTGPEKKRGFIDRTGRIITAPAWDGALNHVAEGLGAVRRGNSWALVNKNGKLLGEPEWNFRWECLRADLGFLPIWKDNKWGAINFDGTILIPTEWETMTPGKNGVLFGSSGAEALFIRKNGQTLFTTGPWDEVRGNKSPVGNLNNAITFSEGYLAVRSGDKWGLIDEQGNTVIPPAWDLIGDVHEGLVAVKNNDSQSGWQFLKSDGSPAFEVPEGLQLGNPNRRDSAPRFRDGLVRGWKEKQPLQRVDVTPEGLEVPLRDHPWLPQGYSIKGQRIDCLNRNGYFGYQRNIADSSGRTLVTDVDVNLDSLAHPFPYPGPARYGLATPEGKILIEPKWDYIKGIESGLTLVWKEGRVGALDSDRNLILQPEWDSLRISENNLLRAKRGEREFIFDSKGVPVLPEEMAEAKYIDSYRDGCIVKTERPDGTTLWSLCDPSKGAPVHFENASRVYWNYEFTEYGVLWIEERDSGQWALINRDGTPTGIKAQSKPDLSDIRNLGLPRTETANLTALKIADLTPSETGGKWGFMDKTGKLVIPAVWDDAGEFENIGTESTPVLRAVVSVEGKHGLIDAKGNLIGKPRWDRIDRFQKAGEDRWLATVHSDSLQGLIDGNGTVVSGPQWDGIGEFRDYKSARWIASATLNGKVGFLDAAGKVVVEPIGKQQGFTPYPGLLVLKVEDKGTGGQKDAYFLPDGTPINPATLRGNIGLGGTQILKTTKGKSGLYSHNGTVLVEPRWDHMGWVAPGIAAAWTNSNGALFDTKGRILFRDNATRRLVRFRSPEQGERGASPYMHRHGMVLIETPPVWGYAKFQPPQPAEIQSPPTAAAP
jgi:hypothetical protein